MGVSALRRVECERRSGVMRKKGVVAGEAARAKERRMAGREEAKRVMRGWESGGRATGVEVELTAKEQKACCESVSVLLGVRAVCETDTSVARMGMGVMMERSCAMMVQYPREITTSTGVAESSARVNTVE